MSDEIPNCWGDRGANHYFEEPEPHEISWGHSDERCQYLTARLTCKYCECVIERTYTAGRQFSGILTHPPLQMCENKEGDGVCGRPILTKLDIEAGRDQGHDAYCTCEVSE